MQKTVNANAYRTPTLWVEIDTLRVPVAVPTLAVAESIMARAAEVAKLTEGLTEEGLREAFELLATVLSCNHNYAKYSADDLMARNITVDQIIGLLTDYIKFLGDVADAKN